jgi:hypothetical protein
MSVNESNKIKITDFCYKYISQQERPIKARELVIAYENRYKSPIVTTNRIGNLLKSDRRFKRVKIGGRYGWDTESLEVETNEILKWHTDETPQRPGFSLIIESCPGCNQPGRLRRMKRRTVGDTYYIHHGDWKSHKKTRCTISWANSWWDLIDWIYKVVREEWNIETETQFHGFNIAVETWFNPFKSMFTTTVNVMDGDYLIEPIHFEKQLYTQKQVEEWHNEVLTTVKMNGICLKVNTYKIHMDALS